MRRVIGIDIHRTFREVVICENGLTRHEGRIDMIRTALEGFGRLLKKTDEVVIEATGNCMAVSRVLSPHVKQVVIANPLQVKAIAHAHVKTDKVDAAMLVEAAWAVAKAPGPLRAFFIRIRIRTRRGHQIAAVAGRAQTRRAVLACAE